MDNFGHGQPWGHHPPLFDPSIIASTCILSIHCYACYIVNVVDLDVIYAHNACMDKQVHPAVKALEQAYELLKANPLASEFLLLQVADARDRAQAELDTSDE